MTLLEGLRPKPEFLRLFRAITLDVWKEKRTSASRLRLELEDPVRALRDREAVLEDAFLFQHRIDGTTYERQRDRIRQDIAMSELELQDATVEEIDVEGLLGFAERVLQNAATLWLEGDLHQKQRIQRALFPSGVEFADGRIGTAATCLAFCQFGESVGVQSSMASPMPTSWNQIAGWLQKIDGLRNAA